MEHINNTIQKLREAGYKENELKKIRRNMLKAELREYYTKVPNTSKNGKEYINLKKQYSERVSFKKNTQTIASFIKFHEEENKVVLWPIGVN